MTPPIEAHIEAHLSCSPKEAALSFVRYLTARGLTFHRDTRNCWKDKIYYWVQHGDACICFISIGDPDEPEHRWTIWSGDCAAYETSAVRDEIRNAAWRYVNHCGSCGSCDGGREKLVFGRRFPQVCGCTFRIDNAVPADLPFLKAMVDLQLRHASMTTHGGHEA
ncbi:MAG: hypothetical protein IKK57_12730 [Clostridia bacterium]|nr:hypothetical protein [Clostridia bacterium]